MSEHKEKSYLLDFLVSFELMYEDLSDDEETILDKIVAPTYKKLIMEYISTFSEKDIFKKFVSKDYNILSSLMLNQKNIINFEQYLQAIKELDKKEFKISVSKIFKIENTDFLLNDMESLELSSEAKWKLLLLLENFDQLKDDLVLSLQQEYAIYCSYADKISDQYPEKIDELKGLFENGTGLYDVVFKDLLVIDKSDFDELQEYLILRISVNRVLLKYKNKQVALGTYVYDYFYEKSKEKDLELEMMQNVLKVLADQTRYGIIKCIGNGITSNKEIATIFSITPSGVTYQLKFLADKEIIRKDNVTKQYVLNNELIKSALATLTSDLDL